MSKLKGWHHLIIITCVTFLFAALFTFLVSLLTGASLKFPGDPDYGEWPPWAINITHIGSPEFLRAFISVFPICLLAGFIFTVCIYYPLASQFLLD